jgi:glycosyltransferase involved in cell wall biosynthesis
MGEKLSIIIPVYNEERLITLLLERVTEALLPSLEKEIIIVNDASTDQTVMNIERFREGSVENIRLISHERNQGKGAAMHTGIRAATGDYLIIQDADMEYDPADYPILLRPLLIGKADVVYGSRFVGSHAHRVLFFYHYLANRFLTFLSNLFTNLNLTDMETGFKAFRTDMIKSLDLKEKRFGFEPEVTAKVSRIKRVRIYEVGISYYGRTYEEGKKIRWKDGVKAIYYIIKYNTWGR